MEQKKNLSELRQDLVSGEWVTIATGRAKRPHDYLAAKRKVPVQPKGKCPFEAVAKKPELLLLISKDHATLADPKKWFVQVVKNKYPAFAEGVCKVFHQEGPYMKMDGVGNHEVVITRDHTRSLAEFTEAESALVIQAYIKRFQALKSESCLDYVLVFHNHGPESGASITHPHSQIIGLPVIPPDVQRSMDGSHAYFKKHRRCAHCDIIRFELETKQRIVYENRDFLVICPFASKTAFEMRILPKVHQSRFEDIHGAEITALGDALRRSLQKLFKGLRNPAYNFFIHTAPLIGGRENDHYHWHLEILPKTAIWAGFEIGTGIEISTIAPESAAAFLKKIKTV